MLNTENPPQAYRFSSGKKILIITLILITSITSMFFRGCDFNLVELFLIGIHIDFGASGELQPGDNVLSQKYSIYVGDNGKIWRSFGETNLIFEEKISGTTQRLNSLRVTSSQFSQTVIACGDNGTIVRSTNTGNNWIVDAPVTSANLYGTDLNVSYYYAVGDNGSLVLGNSSGIWTQISTNTTRNLKVIGISPSNALNVIAAGEKGTIMRSVNSGFNWTNVSLPDTTITFYGISKKELYFSGNNICLVGTSGKIYKSTDQGSTWLQKPSGTTNTLRSIYFMGIDSAVVVGDNGTIRFSTNGGESWFTDSYFNSPSTRQFKSVFLLNHDHFTVTAVSDTLFFGSNDPITVGLQPISLQVPGGFSLSQNYPNPFNPNTKIKFQISKIGNAKLIVFDMLGREVEILVNEQLKAGTYEVNFDGGKYSSGVYFYGLITNEFSETKKMLLIK